MIVRDAIEVARAFVGLTLIKVGGIVAGAPRPNDDRSSLSDHDYPSPDDSSPDGPPSPVVVTPEALAMLARPEPRPKVAPIARVHRRG